MGSPLEGAPRFSSPEEELAYLRAQLAKREEELREHVGSSETLPHAAVETVKAYAKAPPHEVLTKAHQLSPEAIERLSLALPPDEDDAVVYELLSIAHEKGIKNSLSVLEARGVPHLEDDFHRALVQYIREGHHVTGIPEGAPLWESVHMTLYELAFPKMSRDSERTNTLKEVISAMEHFYTGMLSISSPDTLGKRHYALEVAVSADHEDIVFYCAVPTDKRILFEKHLSSVFPDARMLEQPGDYNIFVKGGNTLVANARLSQDAIIPLKTYESFDHDPLNVIVNVFSKLAKKGEGAALQLIIRPVGDRYAKRYKKVLEKLEKGMTLKKALDDTPEGLGGEILKSAKEFLFASGAKKDKQTAEPPRVDQGILEQVRAKLSSHIVSANIRIVVSTLADHRAESVLAEIASSFNQFSSAQGNAVSFTTVPPKRRAEAVRNFSFRLFSSVDALPLTIAELTTILHFPAPGSIHASPELKQAKSKEVSAPLGLPQEGTFLGTNVYRGKETRAFLTHKDRVRHLYVIGQTGTGKSVFLQNMAVQDIRDGHGVCFIDPHGSDVQDILAAVPEHRYDDVIYFDPGTTERVMALNMLEYDPAKPEQKTFVVNELFGIFRKLYSHSPESMGPAFEQYFRNATALVIEDPASGNTLLDVSRVLSDEAYRNFKLSRSKNPIVNQFWTGIATKAGGEASLANIVPYITNKFDIFTANEIMRPIIAQPKSTFNFRELMDTRKILLVNLSKGKLGDINANLLGLILVGKILMAALSRVDMHGERPPFYLYIDEFQNITTDSISAILSEARKYALGLTVAHQFIAQLAQGIRDAVFGNVGSMAVFRVGTEDAEFLERQFSPTFSASDIMNIDNYHCYLRLLANGIPQTPFNIKTAPPPSGDARVRDFLKEQSALRYGRVREDVEAMIRKRYQ